MTLSTKTLLNASIRGLYMGGAFIGTIIGIEANESGYASDRNSCRLVIALAADLTYGNEHWTLTRKAGERIIMHAESKNGLLARADDKYASVTLRRAA